MKQRRGFFWIGMLLSGALVFRWVRRRLGATESEQQSSAGSPNRAPLPAEPVARPLQQVPTPLPEPPSVAADNLEEINGIGATYARRLRAAGIHTFADLAALTPAEARKLARAEPWQANTAAWIAQAAERGGQ